MPCECHVPPAIKSNVIPAQTKKGATPCSNLFNLKSNTMKNTLQMYKS